MQMTRTTLFVEHFESAEDYDRVTSWLERWKKGVHVADYSTGGYEHIWNVEGPDEALSELPQEYFCSSEWAGI